MRVAQRLYLAVMPAVLGVLLVAGLAYWGEVTRQVPEVVLIVAAIASVGSLVLVWRNTRYVATRIERLAGSTQQPRRETDELATIERVVDTLSSEVAVAREAGAEREKAASERVNEYAGMLAEVSSAVGRRLDEARLPLHILLENHFGELNENQEEMLSAARAAIEDADGELRRLRDVAQLDQGALSLRRDPIRFGDVITSLLPTLNARAEREGVRLNVIAAPALPRVLGDPARLREALALVLGLRIEQTLPDETVKVDVDHELNQVRIRVSHGSITATGAEEILARRLLEAHGGRINTTGNQTEIVLPALQAAPTIRKT